MIAISTRVLIVSATAYLASVSAQTLDAPTAGLAYNTTERSSLTYNCKKIGPMQLQCEFVQSAIRPKATISDLATEIERGRKEFRDKRDKVADAESCQMFGAIADVIEGRRAAPNADYLKSMTPVEKSDYLALARAYKAMCAKPSMEAVDAVTRASHDRERRTCLVSGNSFVQLFKPAQDSGSGKVWVVQDTPSGPCGVIRLDRFEAEEVLTGTSKGTLWNYVARKAVTNPNGEVAPGAKCAALDEGIYRYDWKPKEHQLSCDYIQFSP